MKKLPLLALGCFFLFVSCGTVTMERSLAKDSYSFKQDPAKKVLLIAITGDENNRRSVENDMKAKLIERIPDVQTSYNVIKSGESIDKLMDFIQKNKFTHIITMRLASVQKEIELKPGAYIKTDYYSSFPVYYRDYGVYLDKTWESVYQPETVDEHIQYTLETNVYSLKDQGLVYSALTSSFKGSGFDKTIYATLSTVRKDMKKAGLFK
ncbi:hypothetical protein M2347_002731 [Chryseobacterium sp. H1D6B]|uniref:hypothetical protein n=1 Tax=Chryseobacterium sp. H1D6B TaxID=2940588 RepID=UPI0015CE9AEC|nr:hypothetical protein [Chryseobacterium sp. H1D6B]MDH6253004.1 hypothetical protein [Chryseobacterium sp. H1D6B]